MSNEVGGKNFRLQQEVIDGIMQMRETYIAQHLKPEAYLSVAPGQRLSDQPFTINDFLPDRIDLLFACLQDIINNNLVDAQWNLYYKKYFGRVMLLPKAMERVASENAEILNRAKVAQEQFVELFLNGQATLNNLPLPEQPTFEPREDEVPALEGGARAEVAYHHILKMSQARQRLKEKLASRTGKEFQGLSEYYNEINHVFKSLGDLQRQLKFCVFVQTHSKGKTLKDLNSTEINQWVNKFIEDAKKKLENEDILAGIKKAFSEEPNAAPVQAKVKKKNKKKKKKPAPVQQQMPKEAIQLSVQLEPKIDVAAQKRVQLNMRLNQFQDESVCALHPRVKRWGQVDLSDPASLKSIRAFIDFDPNNRSIKLYHDLPLSDLRLHKENHDIPLHTILREKDLIARYSFHQIHRNARNEPQHTRVFYAEKTMFDQSGKSYRELGLIHAAVDNEGTVYHSMFKKASHIEVSEVTRQYAYPDAEEHAEGKEDEAQPFQFAGNYHIEIDPKDEAIVIKIGQDGELNQVIYKILLL